MKMYKVNVNGQMYEITLEECDVNEVKAAPAAPAAAPAAPAAAAPAAGAESITSPMPGTILSVNVSNGSQVKKGDILFILEAMKMENEIMAPRDGVVGAVSVAKGASVEAGAALCTLA